MVHALANSRAHGSRYEGHARSSSCTHVADADAWLCRLSSVGVGSRPRRRGLEPTPTLLSLRGQRVRVVGHMVREEEPIPGVFLMTSVPVALAELADGPADYLPPATLYVYLPPDRAGQLVSWHSGVLEAVGTLELGMRAEPNQRYSYARLILDDVDAVTAVASAHSNTSNQ